VGKKLFPILLVIAVGALLSACSNGPEEPEICWTGTCTSAPKKATSRPYQIKGVWYHPQPHYEYDETGTASYYGGSDIFHGRPTATGEIFDMNDVSAAHKTLPLPCIAEVTNLENGRQIQLKVNDRGPFVHGRIIDVSRRTAQLLGFDRKGTAKVRVRTLVPESLALNGINPSDVMVAQAAPPPPVKKPLPVEAVPMMTAALPKLPDHLFEEVIEEESPVQLASAASTPTAATTPASQPSHEAPASTGIFVETGKYQSEAEAHAISKKLDGITDTMAQAAQTKGLNTYVVQLGPLLSMSQAIKYLINW
jgi:rare lipoprotein A